MAVGVFPGFLTPVLTQLFFAKPPTTFLTCFCRGERRKYDRDRTHNHQVMSPTRSPLSHPALNLVILALICVKLSSGQGLVYRLAARRTYQPTDRQTDRPTDMSKAIYPHFVEGGGIIKIVICKCFDLEDSTNLLFANGLTLHQTTKF